jgi:nuclear cap-binding protein subunit 1
MWVEKHIVRPYLAFDSILCEALQHNLPQLVPPPHHPSTTYPLPKVVFRMFDYTDCPEVSLPSGLAIVQRCLRSRTAFRVPSFRASIPSSAT